MNWALSVQLPGPGIKAVLMALANYADENNECFPGQDRLARETCQGVRTVQRHLATLSEMGLVAIKARGGSGGGRWPNWYRLAVGAQPANLAARGNPPTETGATRQLEQGNPPLVAYEPLLEPSLEEPPLENTPSPDGEAATDDGSLFPAPPTEKARTNEQALKKDFEGSFWPVYPRKVGKFAARAAYLRARKKASFEDIQMGLKRHAAACAGKEARFIPHASTWLNAGRWMDEPDQPPQGPSGVSGGYRPYQNDDYWSSS
jgi:hypothetical protein